MKNQRNLPITLTFPEDTIKDLHLYISRRQMSKFVADLVLSALEEKKKLLALEVRKAAEDTERNTEIELWDSLIGDGLDETNSY